MALALSASLWAVHIPENVLAGTWLLAGFLLAAVLAGLGAVRVREEEIPRIALLTAVFFLATLMHVRIGPTSVHLLLNGLIGAVLGWRAALAIPIGLFLQAAFIGHGAFSTLGVNSCVMVLPALATGLLLRQLGGLPGLRRPWAQTAVVAVCAAGWLASGLYAGALLLGNPPGTLETLDCSLANRVLGHPVTLAGILLVTGFVAWLERRLEHPPHFALGLLAGELAVLLTLLLNSLALIGGGQADWHALVLLVLIVHLPIAAVEGIILGFTVAFVYRVQPGLLGLEASSPVKRGCQEYGVQSTEY